MKLFTREKSRQSKFNKTDITVSKKYSIMGGEFIFKCYPQSFFSKAEVEELFDLAFKEVKRIEDKFTDFKSSEFNQINELAGISPCPVDQEVFDLIKKSIEISKISKGRFDISFASIGHLWRKAKERGESLSLYDRKSLKEFIDYKKIIMDEESLTVYLPSEKMRIGLGGIGKGYAVDQAYSFLRDAGLYNFYVNGSGDIRVHSKKDAPRQWRVGIRNPFSKDKEKSVGVVQLSSGSISTSGSYVQFNPVENSSLKFDDHHIISASTGSSCSEVVSATVLSEDCITSDSTGTILMNMSPKDAISYLDEQGLIGFVINQSGETSMSQRALNRFGI